jgi:hypothetical protein
MKAPELPTTGAHALPTSLAFCQARSAWMNQGKTLPGKTARQLVFSYR